MADNSHYDSGTNLLPSALLHEFDSQHARLGNQMQQAPRTVVKNNPEMNVQCYNCNGQGHIARDCSTVEKNSSTECFKCHGFGHFAINCPNIRNHVCYVCNELGHHGPDCPTLPPEERGRSFRGRKREAGPSRGVATSVGYSVGRGAYAYEAERSHVDMGRPGAGYHPYSRSPYDERFASPNRARGPDSYSGYAGYPMPNPGNWDYRPDPMAFGQRDHPGQISPSGYGGAPVIRGIGEFQRHPGMEYGRHPAEIRPQYTEVMKCFRCGDNGHYVRDCRANGASAARDSCYKCGESGHKALDCQNSADIRKCFVCNQVGHTSRNCPHGGGPR